MWWSSAPPRRILSPGPASAGPLTPLRGVRVALSPRAAMRDASAGIGGGLAPRLGRRVEDRRAVLRAAVVPLSVLRRGIVHAEEPLLEQVGVRQLRRVEDDAYRFGVAGPAAVHVAVRGGRRAGAAGVADVG